jgi:GNAT superfamily N-acetyltransferase
MNPCLLPIDDLPMVNAILLCHGVTIRRRFNTRRAARGCRQAAGDPAGGGRRVPGRRDEQRRGKPAAAHRDEPVGFVVTDVVDGAAHIEQISVHPAHARQRIGAMLIDHVAGWAARRGLPALTLITFRGVPWNAPYYERLGFRELSPAELTPGLAALWSAAPGSGRDGSPERVCMRRDVIGGTRPAGDANS